MDTYGQFFLLTLCLIFSAFFSCVETAFTSLSDIRIQHLADQKKKGIERVKALKNQSHHLIITILIGNNLVNIAASSIATAMAIDMFESNAIGIVVGVMTLIILIFGEIIPKTIAISKNEWIAIHTAPLIRFFQFILFPAIIILAWLSRLISKPITTSQAFPIITEDEIKSVVVLGEEVGEVEKDERIMIHNIFRFSDLKASEIMVDRTRMFTVDASQRINDISRQVIEQGYSRIPVYEDGQDNIKGILYIKDMLKAMIQPADASAQIKNIIKPAKFIPGTMLVDDLLRDFQKEQVHIAMVVDEHGGISGLVTFEDLLEEIVGEIYDETDEEMILVRKTGRNKAIISGETEIEVVNAELNLHLNEKDDFETISGLILSHLRYIPTAGESLQLGNIILKITKADPQRIIEVELEIIPDEERGGGVTPAETTS